MIEFWHEKNVESFLTPKNDEDNTQWSEQMEVNTDEEQDKIHTNKWKKKILQPTMEGVIYYH